MTTERPLPTQQEMLAKQFHGSVTRYATALRELADTVEQHGRRLGTQTGLRVQPVTATEIASGIQHEIEWGLANANFAQVITNAADYDNRDEK